MIYAGTVYCDLGPKLGLVVRKCLPLLGNKRSKPDGALATSASLRLKVSQIGTAMGFPLEILALSGPEEALMLAW